MSHPSIFTFIVTHQGIFPIIVTLASRLDHKVKEGVISMKHKVIALPKLNLLSPTMESTALKLMEETGELAQAIGKFRGLSGETMTLEEKEVMEMVTRELLDVAQTAVSMMYVLEEEYKVDIGVMLEEHIQKLIDKGYLSY